MPSKRRGQGQSKEAIYESEQRLAAAAARRDAAFAKAKVGDELQTELIAVTEDAKKPTVFEMLSRHKYVGIPLRVVQAKLDQRRKRKEAAEAREAKRVWEMMQMLEPGMRVKLMNVGRIGGVKYDGKLATVIADVGSRYAVRLDAVDPDGVVHEGQGTEIKVGANNMQIYDEEVEQVLAEQEAESKIRAKEERAALIRDIREGNWKKILGQVAEEEEENPEENEDDIDPADEVKIEYANLTDDTSIEDLHLFHKQKRMKEKLSKHDTQEEVLSKIREEWTGRLAAIKKFERSIQDAEDSIIVGVKVPAVRDPFRRFVINPAFAISTIGLKDARGQLTKLLSWDITKGTLVSGSLAKVILQKLPPEKGGPSMDEGKYNGKQLICTGGMSAGQYGVIQQYYPVDPLTAEERVCHILHWYPAYADMTSKYQILNMDYGVLHVKGRARKGDKTSITLAEDADSMKNSYKGMLIKITKGPGKSQRAKILTYDGETKQCLVDKWIWDKSIMERAWDQDDDGIPTVPPTEESYYCLKMEDAKERTIDLHLSGRCSKNGYEGAMFVSKHAPDFDMYSGRTVEIVGGIGKGQRTRIVLYEPARKLCKVEPWQASVPDNTTKYKIVESEFDEHLFKTEQQLFKMLQKSRELAQKEESNRKSKIRRRMWAAVRIYAMGAREGASIEKQRMEQAAAAWAAVGETNEAQDDENSHMVNGKLVKCSWKSIVLDSEPAFQEVEVITSDDECNAILYIKIVQARDLIAADSSGTSDPYVRIYMGDDIKGAVKTKVVPKNLNPVWNEKFEIQVPGALRRELLTIEVFDKDLIGSDDLLGKFTISLSSMELRPTTGTYSSKLFGVVSRWYTFDPVPKAHPSDPDNNGEIEIEFELVKKPKADDDGSAAVMMKEPRPGHLSWNGYVFRMPLYSTVERSKDGSIMQPILIVNADNGQQLYKGKTSHWKVWQSLLAEGEQLEERDDVFRWRDRLVLQPFTTINEEGRDIYTVVDNDTGQILYSGPDEEATEEDLALLENQLDRIPAKGQDDDRGMLTTKDLEEKERLKTSQEIERVAATKALSSQTNSAALLKLKVIRAKELIAADRGGKSDPYCVIRVGPGGGAPFFETKTRVVKKTLEPEFGEDFDFMLDPQQRRGVLTIEVFDKNVTKDVTLGKFDIPLHTLTPLQDYNQWNDLAIENEEHESVKQGQVLLEYKMIPSLPPAILRIEIVRAKELIAADSGGTSDPYACIYIGDQVNKGKKTTIKKKTLNPEWNEQFELDVAGEQRRDLLSIECFDYDALSADDSLGKVSIHMDELVPGTEYEENRQLEPPDGKDDYCGQIEIKYCLLPILGPAILDFQVLRARNLQAADRGGTSDPYVRIHVGNAISSEVKTSVKKKTLNPVWEESFSIRLESAQRRQQLQIECFDKDMIGSDDTLGRNIIELGNLVNKQQYKEWLKLNNVQQGGPDNQGEIECKYMLLEIVEKDNEVESEDVPILPPHSVGGQDWENIQDPLLWKALLEESIKIPGEDDKFSWRGIVCCQPVHDGKNSVVESVGGQVIFFGPNPNEKTDFPSELEQQEIMRMRKLEAKGKINKMCIETDDGKYEGGMRYGQFQGDGIFMWNDGMVYSGQYVDDLREGTGTEIFPVYDNVNVDENGEKKFPYYEGQFLDGMRHGKGRYFYADGNVYMGMFKYNLFDGLGTFLWENGDYLEGNWRNGVPLTKEIKHQVRKKTASSRHGTAASGERSDEDKPKKKKKKKSKKTKTSSPGGYGFAQGGTLEDQPKIK